MSFAEELNTDPTAGADAGATTEGTQPAALAAPAERTYTQREYDRQFADARRSFESQARRDREAAVQAARTEWQRSQAPTPKPDDPFAPFDPTVAQALRAALEAHTKPLNDQLASYRQKQEDLAFASDESRIAAKYPDYQKNRADILRFGALNGISNVDAAYRAWKYDELSSIDLKKVGMDAVAAHIDKARKRASDAPITEGRGGGAPSTKTNFRGKDGKLDKDAMDAAALEIIRGQE